MSGYVWDNDIAKNIIGGVLGSYVDGNSADNNDNDDSNGNDNSFQSDI